MITIKSSTLKALLVTVTKNKTRYHLRGVHFCRRADDVLYASTDGKRLTIATEPLPEEIDESDPSEGILPINFCEQALKLQSKLLPEISFSFSLYSSPDPTVHGRIVVTHTASGLHTQLVDGRYPDYARVIPRTFSGEVSQFNPADLADVAKIQKIIGDKNPPYILHNGKEAVLIVFHRGDMVQVMSSMHIKNAPPTVPAWLPGPGPETA